MTLELSTQPMPEAAGAVLRLALPMTIQHAAELRGLLVDAFEAGAGGVDLAGVDQCDSAGVQLLLSAQRSLAARGTALQVFNAGGAVLDILGRYGLLPSAEPLQGKA
jgi:anti-sigma B factor antagonist